MIRLGVAAPVRQRCGVADYARFLAAAMPADFEVARLPFPDGRQRSDWRRLGLRAGQHDLVHVHYETGLFGRVKPLRNRFGTLLASLVPPAVVTLHGELPPLVPRWRVTRPYRLADLARDLAYLPFFPAWERRQARRAAHWIVHSHDLAERLERRGAVGRLSVIPHPVPKTGRTWQFDGTGDGLHLVTPGFLAPAKGLERLLEVVGATPEARWTLAGGPRDEAGRAMLGELEERREALGLGRRVQITGVLPREEIERHLAKATLAVFPYTRASGSGALTWAIGVGTPIVAADLPAFRGLRDAGAGVELVAGDEPEAWIASLRRAATPPQAIRLAERNRAYAASHDYPRLAARTAELFRSLIEG